MERRAEAERRATEEARKQAEAERRATEEARKQAEAQSKAEEEAREREDARRQAEQSARKAREDELLAALDAELDAAQSASELNQYILAIDERIRRVWVRPAGGRRNLVCTVELRLIPGGEVVPGSVRILRGSGDPAYDRSVIGALYKASPLPVPSGRLFERFRDAQLVFKAEN